jgi:hypothetical protein
VTKDVAERLQLVELDDTREGCAVTLFDGLRQLLHRLGVGRQPGDRLRKFARIRRAIRGPWRSAELEADKCALFRANPLADEAASRDEMQTLQDRPKLLPIALAIGFVKTLKRPLVLRELAENGGVVQNISEYVQLERCVGHVLPRVKVRMPLTFDSARATRRINPKRVPIWIKQVPIRARLTRLRSCCWA